MSNLVEKKTSVASLLKGDGIKKRFEEVLGKKAAGFMSSIISAVSTNPGLAKADPKSVIASAAVAATLDLPINSNLGFAYIIPYGVVATCQVGYRGFIQLAMRTGQYKTINVTEVYEGELIEDNRITGLMEFDTKKKVSDKIIGYVAYFKLLNGFEKYLYMTMDQVKAHGQKYSKSYKKPTGQWATGFDGMAKKTVLKMLLSKFGILSVEMQTATTFDQAAVGDQGQAEYVDGISLEEEENTDIVVDAELAEIQKALGKGKEKEVVKEDDPDASELDNIDEDKIQKDKVLIYIEKELIRSGKYDDKKVDAVVKNMSVRSLEDLEQTLIDLVDLNTKGKKEDK